MAGTPHEAPTATQKRPLEEPSSPSGPTDQPDAKRPALDKLLKGDGALTEPASAGETVIGSTEATTQEGQDTVADLTAEVDQPADETSALAGTDKQGDTVVPDAPTNGDTSNAPVPQGLPAHSPVLNGLPENRAGSQAPMPYHQQDETGWLHVRAIISSAEAATVIGKGGENVSQIRRMAGAKCTVSEYSRGAVERILTVSGLVDAVAKVKERLSITTWNIADTSRLSVSSFALLTKNRSNLLLPHNPRRTRSAFSSHISSLARSSASKVSESAKSKKRPVPASMPRSRVCHSPLNAPSSSLVSQMPYTSLHTMWEVRWSSSSPIASVDLLRRTTLAVTADHRG